MSYELILKSDIGCQIACDASCMSKFHHLEGCYQAVAPINTVNCVEMILHALHK